MASVYPAELRIMQTLAYARIRSSAGYTAACVSKCLHLFLPLVLFSSFQSTVETLCPALYAAFPREDALSLGVSPGQNVQGPTFFFTFGKATLYPTHVWMNILCSVFC